MRWTAVRALTASVALVAAATLTSTGAFAARAPAAAARPYGTFTMYMIPGTTYDPAIWDWGAHNDQIGLFVGLVHFGANGAVVPGIATSWKTNGNVWTFYLRHNARFSNGDPVTADTFVSSWRRAVNPATVAGTGDASSFFGDVQLKNAQKIRLGKLPLTDLGVTALSRYTLQVTLDHPDPYLLTKLATDPWALPVDPSVVGQSGASSTASWTNPKTIVGDGPYMLKSLKLGVDAWLVPNPYYYNPVHLAAIHLIYTSTAGGTQLAAYEANNTDMAELGATNVPAVRRNPTLKSQLHWVPTAVQYTFYMWHSLNPVFSNVKVRQAFEYAINKTLISQKILLGTGTPAYDPYIASWMAPWIKGVGYHYNPTKAQELLAEAGYPGGKGFPAVTMLEAAFGPDPVAEAVQQMWETNLHVKVNLVQQEWGTYLTSMEQTQSTAQGWVQDGIPAPSPVWQMTLPNSVPSDFLSTWALSGADWTRYQAISKDAKLTPAQRLAQSAQYALAHLPSNVKGIIAAEVQAFAANNVPAMKSAVSNEMAQAYNIPIYTVTNAVLLKPNVHGYFPQRMWLSTPPDWLNTITISR